MESLTTINKELTCFLEGTNSLVTAQEDNKAQVHNIASRVSDSVMQDSDIQK